MHAHAQYNKITGSLKAYENLPKNTVAISERSFKYAYYRYFLSGYS